MSGRREIEASANLAVHAAAEGTYVWVDPQEKLCAVMMLQMPFAEAGTYPRSMREIVYGRFCTDSWRFPLRMQRVQKELLRRQSSVNYCIPQAAIRPLFVFRNKSGGSVLISSRCLNIRLAESLPPI
jgi:hypothetical protein